MPNDSRLDVLLDRYQDRLDVGRTPDLDDLCRDYPDLRADLEKRVARLHKVGQLLGDVAPPPAAPPRPDPELSLSDDKTWVSHGAGYAPPLEIPAPPGYQILAPLGEGGMGVVYKARQIGLDRLVALKMILGGTRARAVDLARFRNEAQAIAALRHPNIVQVFEIAEFRDQPFFSLEFCAGGTLAKAVNGEPQSPSVAAGMSEVLARAIHYAHSRGIVHRDLKPGNVLLSAEPAAPSHAPSTIQADPASEAVAQAALRPPYVALKITDFGLAKRVDDDSGRTQDGSVMGTPAYMAPEQAFGLTKEVAAATDVHALGAILYELLTGRPPFKGSTVHDTLEQVRHRDPVPVRTVQPQVPPDLETICLKCLQKDPKRRYLTAAALADDLRRFLDHRPIQARPVGQVARAWRWARREPRTAGLVASIGALCIAVPALLVGYSNRLERDEKDLDSHRMATVAAQKAEKAAKEAGETNRYLAALNKAGRLRSERRPGWTWEARAQVEIAAAAYAAERDVGALRTELAAAVAAIDLRPVAVTAKGLPAAAIAFAPDGRLAVAPRVIWSELPHRQIVLFDPKTKTEQYLSFKVSYRWGHRQPDTTTALAFSPDGKWLFLGLRNGGILRWQVDATPIPNPIEWRGHDADVTGFAFSPDFRWLYSTGRDGRAKRWKIDGDGKSSKVWRQIGGSPSEHSGIAYWSGARPGLLIVGKDRGHLIDPETMLELGPTKVNGIDWVAPAIAGGSDRLAVHPPSGTIVVSRGRALDVSYWERGILQPIATLTDRSLDEPAAHAGKIEAVAVHPSGMLVATVCPDEGMAKVWQLGKEELAVCVPAPDAYAVAFNADGSQLAVGGDHVTTLYEVGGQIEHTFLGHRGYRVRALGVTHDGKVVTVAGGPDQGAAVVSLWDESGSLDLTAVHRAVGPVVTGRYCVAASRAKALTAVHVGDDTILSPRAEFPPTAIPRIGEDRSHFDLAIDDGGQFWAIADGKHLLVRPAGPADKWRPINVNFPWGGRLGLLCVRAGGGNVLVGCDNGYLRVMTGKGEFRGSLACFPEEDMVFRESANSVRAVALTDDGTRAVAGTEDGRLWSFRLPGERLGDWHAHRDRVTAVAFDRTGEWLASGGRDRMVRLWRRTGDRFLQYMTLQVPDGSPVLQVAFSADGKRLLVLREKESAVRVWHLDKLRARFSELQLDP